MILQCLLPCLAFQNGREFNLSITGGTLTAKQPPIYKVKHLLVPLLHRMGLEMDYEVVKQGLFPDVIGEVRSTVKSVTDGQCLKPI